MFKTLEENRLAEIAALQRMSAEQYLFARFARNFVAGPNKKEVFQYHSRKAARLALTARRLMGIEGIAF